MDSDKNKDQHKKSQTGKDSSGEHKTTNVNNNSDGRTKNRDAQKSGRGYDHPTQGAEPYKDEEE